MRKLLFFLIFTSFVSQLQAQWLGTEDYSLYTEQLRLEASIRNSLQNILATQLAPETFQVGTSIKLRIKKVAEKQSNENYESNRMPSDISLGIIDVNKVIESYEEEMKLMRGKQEQNPAFEIDSVKIFIGLHEKYGDKYFRDFEKWIVKYARSDIFANAKVQLTKIKKAEEKKDPFDKNKTGFEEKNIYDKIKDFQVLLSVLFAVLTLIFTAFLLERLRSKTILKKKQMELDHTNSLLPEGMGEPEEDPEEDLLDSESNVGHDEQYARLGKMKEKLSKLYFDVGMEIVDLVRLWINDHDNGFDKLALLLDSVKSFNASSKQDELVESRKLEGIKAIYKPHSSAMKETFESISELFVEEQIELAEKIYWEILSLNVLGEDSIKKPFDFLASTSKDDLDLILSGQNDTTKAMVVLHLPSVKQKEWVESLDYAEKKKLLSASIEKMELETSELKDIETSVKVVSRSIEATEQKEKVNLMPKTIKVLESLSLADEIKILRELSSEGGNNLSAIKKMYVSLAFLDEWKKDKLVVLLKKCTTENLGAFLYLLPELEDIVLSNSPDRVRQIVKDDLKLDRKPGPEDVEKNLRILKAKLIQVLESDNMILKDLYMESSQAVQSAA